ncbi:CRISPR-associated endoribonuclease Cas6 [Alkalihalobacillus oceani]|uniref:CRISPR-associated endoribonuclease Cas6 n=1 Tax=Halalkalibacter oceani TaxID=1653776 RepID=UPI00203ED5BA|nr:CRISPR-associated endoribonuclease Cas6 [Halalkalibacter oceani]MCM3761173.1 CRISPR-associated endoribonuclease Cas6 [Halalkalibacter oceani]
MRIQINFQVASLPIAYRFVVLSFLKEAIKKGDETYFKRLYEEGEGKMKPFSYSVFLKNFTIQRNEIELDQISVTVSSSDIEYMLHLFNGIQLIREYQTRRGAWKMLGVRMVKEWEISSSSINCRTLSPILIENRHGKPVHLEDESYRKEFSYYANLRIKELSGRNAYKPIMIEPIRMRKVVVKESNSTLRKETEGELLTYTAYQGELRLDGHPEDLQLLYQSGVGKRTSQGFGLLDIIREG